MSEPLIRVSPEPLIPVSEIRGELVIFDSNLITKFRAATKNPKSQLGELLRFLKGGSARNHYYMLLPAVVETKYHQSGSTVQGLLDWRARWIEEPFSPEGAREFPDLIFTSAEHTPLSFLSEMFVSVALNYWYLLVARRAANRFAGKSDRKSAVNHFFDEINSSGFDGAGTKLPFLAISSALCGNDDAIRALNIGSDKLQPLINGSWDLYFWHLLVQLWLMSDKTKIHPYMFTGDHGAAGVFTKMAQVRDGVINISFGSNKEPLDDRAVEQARIRGESTPKGSSREVDWLSVLNRLVPNSDRCPEFESLLRHLRQLTSRPIS